MKKITLILALFVSYIAMAQFTFPAQAGPFSVTQGTPTSIDLNDSGNTAGVTAVNYESFTITADWANVADGPWSSEAEVSVHTASGTVTVDPPSSGGAHDPNSTTLTFEGTFASYYDPSTDGTFSIDMNQSFQNTTATWSNIVVTLNPAPTCTAPTATASVVDDCGNSQFRIEVNVTSLGDATSVTITNDAGIGSTTVTATGVVTIGPFAAGPNASVSLGLEHDQDSECNGMTMGPYTDDCSDLPPITVDKFDISGCGDSATTSYSAGESEIVWVELTYDGVCSPIIIDTIGSTATGGLDTELGLYNSMGELLFENDDIIQIVDLLSEIEAADWLCATRVLPADVTTCIPHVIIDRNCL